MCVNPTDASSVQGPPLSCLKSSTCFFFRFSFSLLPLLLSFFFSLLTQGLHVAQGDPEFAEWLKVLLPFTSPEFWDYRRIWGHQGFLFLPFNLKILLWVWLEFTPEVHTSVAKDSDHLFSVLQAVVEAGVNKAESFWGLWRKEFSGVFQFLEAPAFLASLAVPSGDFPGC